MKKNYIDFKDESNFLKVKIYNIEVFQKTKYGAFTAKCMTNKFHIYLGKDTIYNFYNFEEFYTFHKKLTENSEFI